MWNRFTCKINPPIVCKVDVSITYYQEDFIMSKETTKEEKKAWKTKKVFWQNWKIYKGA